MSLIHISAVAGFLIGKELSIMGKALEDPARPFIAVSYTHLDVYKRQVFHRPVSYGVVDGKRLPGMDNRTIEDIADFPDVIFPAFG